jgi:hypothetical protein
MVKYDRTFTLRLTEEEYDKLYQLFLQYQLDNKVRLSLTQYLKIILGLYNDHEESK